MQINEVHYCDPDGNLIWKDNIVFRRIWGVGNTLIHDSKSYIVRRVAIANSIEYVNVEEFVCQHLPVEFDYICVRCGEIVASK